MSDSPSTVHAGRGHDDLVGFAGSSCPPSQFSKNGYAYRLLDFSGRVALYEARSRTDGGVRAYEVHTMRRNRERAIRGVIVPAGPRLASDEDFGEWAWSFVSEVLARQKFKDLIVAEAAK